jgi:uncharacterized protein (UPF0276 family)
MRTLAPDITTQPAHGVRAAAAAAAALSSSVEGRVLVEEIDPLFVSDHLCWTRIGSFNSHDLLPVPYTEEALDVVCRNVMQAQEVLGRTLLIENPSNRTKAAPTRLLNRVRAQGTTDSPSLKIASYSKLPQMQGIGFQARA